MTGFVSGFPKKFMNAVKRHLLERTLLISEAAAPRDPNRGYMRRPWRNPRLDYPTVLCTRRRKYWHSQWKKIKMRWENGLCKEIAFYCATSAPTLICEHH